MDEKMFLLGSMLKDRVSGFVGMVTARCQYLGAGDRYQLTATSADKGTEVQCEWFDGGRLQEVE